MEREFFSAPVPPVVAKDDGSQCQEVEVYMAGGRRHLWKEEVGVNRGARVGVNKAGGFDGDVGGGVVGGMETEM